MTKEQIVRTLLKMFEKQLKQEILISNDYERNRKLFRGLCNMSLSLNGIDKQFYDLQDKLLQTVLKEKQIVDVEKLEFKNSIAHFNGDITTLKADVIVNAANDEYLGCFYPCHNCIDNVIMSASGFQMRNELLKLKSQPNYEEQKVKVTRGYNLPCRFVFHIAGPICYGEPTNQNEQDLANCYKYCLDKAKEMKLQNIVFCCISTGEYSYPNKKACKVAVKTVKNWLKNNDYCIKVVFNTFKQIDKEIYENELSRENQ